MKSYAEFLANKTKTTKNSPIDAGKLSKKLFPFQRDIVTWALNKGRAAIFADTGLGKTAMQAEWAKHVSAHGRVLILAPLAVSMQTVGEAAKFGVDVFYRREDAGDRITITNYEMLDRFNPVNFIGVVIDESSILKSFDGATRNQIIDAFRDTSYRLACTATPAPNDYTELGNHSEFLGIKTRVEMLSEYFINDMTHTGDWRLKGHAKESFWRWMCSWACVVRKPSDLGYDNGAFDLPPLVMHEHVIPVDHTAQWSTGRLFANAAMTLSEQRALRRATEIKRIQIAKEICSDGKPTIVWCELNTEGDNATDEIPGSAQVKGSDSPESKERCLIGFTHGDPVVLVSKPSIAGQGLNFQHCARMIFLGASHSFEQTYQAIRRCWRFGQTRQVDVHIIRSETDAPIIENYKRKERDAQEMGEQIAKLTSQYIDIKSQTHREHNPYKPSMAIKRPGWLHENT